MGQRRFRPLSQAAGVAAILYHRQPPGFSRRIHKDLLIKTGQAIELDHLGLQPRLRQTIRSRQRLVDHNAIGNQRDIAALAQHGLIFIKGIACKGSLLAPGVSNRCGAFFPGQSPLQSLAQLGEGRGRQHLHMGNGQQIGYVEHSLVGFAITAGSRPMARSWIIWS